MTDGNSPTLEVSCGVRLDRMYCWKVAGGGAPYACAAGYCGRCWGGICPAPECLPFWRLMTLGSFSDSHWKRRRPLSRLTPLVPTANIARPSGTLVASLVQRMPKMI
jgi:hypothetical protein